MIPRTNSLFEQYGTGDLAWLKKGAKVKYQRVTDTGTVTDYRGIILSVRAGGPEFVVEVAGELSGRANLIDKQPVLVRGIHDLGSMVSYAVRGMGFKMFPRFPETGLTYPNEGGTTMLSWLQKLCALSQTAGSPQRTIMPTTWGGTTWAFNPKDTTTVNFTVYADGHRIELDLVDDATEQPNTVFGSGISPDGERWRGAAYPGFFQGPPAEYPMAGGASFGVGTTNEDTVNGDGIRVLRVQLTHFGYLGPGSDITAPYDAHVAEAVNQLKDDAGLPEDGVMTTAAWAALWDIDVTGLSKAGAKILPLAQATRVRTHNRSSTGAIIGRNPDRVPGSLRVDRTIDFGVVEKARARSHAKAIIHTSNGHEWAGTIRLNDIGVFTGEHDGDDADTLTADDLMPARNIRPGMNAWLPYFDGGTLVHVSGVDVDPTSNAVTLTVDTGARDMLDLSEALKRNRESRRNIYREWMEGNRGLKPAGNFISRDEFFGKLYEDVRLDGGRWNMVPVIMGQSGTVSRTDVRLTDVATEFCMAVFAKKVTSTTLQGLIGNPFSVDDNGLTAWEHDNMDQFLERRVLLYVAGQGAQPCGYSWKKGYNSDGTRTANPLVGTHRDDSSWAYVTDPAGDVIVWLAIYPRRNCTLRRGRLFYALEDDVT